MKLSVLIPVYNERFYVGELVRRVLAAPLPEGFDRELIIVDDGSTDGTREVVDRLAAEHPQCVQVVRHDRNRGKGAAIRTAIDRATGEFCIFQDADLEYDPNDYPRVLEPLLTGVADVVYGSRLQTAGRRRILYFWHNLGAGMMTQLCNVLTNLNLTDVATAYKAFRTEILKTIPLRCDGFAMESELTSKVAKRGLRLYEVPVSYDGRTFMEGKKVSWRDGFRIAAAAIWYCIIDDLYDERSGHDILASLSRAHRFNRWMADVLRPYLGARVLEVGAGIGNMTVQFLPREHYVASDMDELHLGVLRNLSLRRVGLQTSRIDATKPSDFTEFNGKIESIVCLNVLEHIPDSSAVLKNFHDVLAPGGDAVVLVPQGPWLYSPLDEALEHVKRYDPDSLRAALTQAGFNVEEVFDFNRIGVIGWLLNGKLLRRRQMAKYQLKMYDMLVWLWRRIDWLLPWHGLSVVAIARKPAAPNTP